MQHPRDKATSSVTTAGKGGIPRRNVAGKLFATTAMGGGT